MFQRIVDDVREYFAAHDVTAFVDEGPEALVAQDNYGPGTSNRVVFVASKDPIAFAAPIQIGEDEDLHRQLCVTRFLFDVHIAGFDPDQPRDLAHRGVCYALLEQTVRAIHGAYWGNLEWLGASWNDARRHARHGAELVATFTLNVPLFDTKSALAHPDPKVGTPKPVP